MDKNWREMQTYLFDDKRSLGHGVLGFVSAIVPCWLGILIIFSYVVYEVREPENPVSTIGDIVEFLVGLSIGVLLHVG